MFPQLRHNGWYTPRQLVRGVTLIEILAAIAIMVILIAVLVPILVTAKEKAKESADLNELHQLGLAGAMYQEQYGDYPTGTEPLVNSGLAPTSICSGQVDSYPTGIANALVLESEQNYRVAESLVTPYRNSYIGPREFDMPMAVLKKQLAGATAEGWLIDLNSATRIDSKTVLGKGRYRRLLNDTSVVTRQMTGHPVVTNGRAGTQYVSSEYFGDLTR